MQDIKGFVICVTPRFGWKHDFTLPLSKVCWRRAELLGNLEDFCVALKHFGAQSCCRCAVLGWTFPLQILSL